MPPDADRDQRLADLLADLSEQARQGRDPDLDAAAAGHPDLCPGAAGTVGRRADRRRASRRVAPHPRASPSSGEGDGRAFRAERAEPAASAAAPAPVSAHVRRLRPAGRDRPRRHGRRLQGLAAQPATHRRPQDDPARRVRHAGGPGPLPDRGPRRRPSRSPQHRGRLRRRRVRRPAVFHHAAGRGPDPRRPAGRRADEAARRGRRAWPSSAGPSTTPTNTASSTATSSRPTC